jgi:Fn3 associated
MRLIIIRSYPRNLGARTCGSRRTIPCLCLLLLILSTTGVRAQRPNEAPLGLAWQVRGGWQIEGKGAPVLTGDAIPPGSLLQPTGEPANHSILIFLPDGQRILYECFLAQDCARGFRVPSLYRKPAPFALDMLARIRTVLSRRSPDRESGQSQGPRLPREETFAALGPGNRVDIAGLAAKLPNGRYTYDLRPLDPASPRQSHVQLEKNGPTITVPLPSPGLYDLTISDQLNTQRIDIFIAAIKPEQSAKVMKSYQDATALIRDWNSNYQGWPIHDFQRAYLEALVLGIAPVQTSKQTAITTEKTDRASITAEPAFSPEPGLFAGDTAVSLRCDTPGATMHYTVDSSQPFDTSPVYHAPIMVKGTALTIKAFAMAPGKKESAVVTGNFWIHE